MNLPKNGDWNWQLPTDWTAITTIDMHTGGEPLRVITGGLPPIAGSTVLRSAATFGNITIRCAPACCSNLAATPICTVP